MENKVGLKGSSNTKVNKNRRLFNFKSQKSDHVFDFVNKNCLLSQCISLLNTKMQVFGQQIKD